MRTLYGPNLLQKLSPDTEMAVEQLAVEKAPFTTVTNTKRKGKGKGKPLGASSPITLIARFTSGTAQTRPSGLFTSWHMKMLPVPRLLLNAIQLLHLMLFDPRVLLPVSIHGEHPSLVLPLRVITSSLSKVVSRTFSSPPMLKMEASFLSLASWSSCVLGRLEPFLIILPLGSSDSTFFLQSIPSVHVAIAR